MWWWPLLTKFNLWYEYGIKFLIPVSLYATEDFSPFSNIHEHFIRASASLKPRIDNMKLRIDFDAPFVSHERFIDSHNYFSFGQWPISTSFKHHVHCYQLEKWYLVNLFVITTVLWSKRLSTANFHTFLFQISKFQFECNSNSFCIE